MTREMRFISSSGLLNLCRLLLLLNVCVDGFAIPPTTARQNLHVLFNQKDPNNNNGNPKKGYQFGDITKSITKSLIGSKVEKLTGKPYEFGDLSRTIDSSIKESINSITGNDDYEFGDLSKFVDSRIKRQVNKFTKQDRYKFGDLTRELLRRVASGEYTWDDLFLLLKALAVFEASISPVAGFLPVKLLVELLNFSLANDVAGRVSSALAMELDRRLKKSILGDENYVLGDATKKTIAGAIGHFTGKGELIIPVNKLLFR